MGDITIHPDAIKLWFQKKEVAFTIIDYDLLRILMENKGKTLNKEFLFTEVWGADSFSENQTLTVHIKMLRDKFEENPKSPKRIVTVWGVGYRYEEI